MEISVVIPAFNEELVIEDTIADIKKFLHSNFSSFEIIVVDDKSKDRTVSVLSEIDGINVLKNKKNHGKGYSVAKGVKAAKGDLILFMDADNSTKIEQFSKFKKYTEDYDIVIASRALPDSDIRVQQSLLKRFLGKAGNLVIQKVLQIKVKDSQCGFKLFKNKDKGLFEKLTIEDWGFDFELLFLASRQNLKIKEVPIIWENNFDSKVKWHSYIKTLGQVFKVRFNYLLNKY